MNLCSSRQVEREIEEELRLSILEPSGYAIKIDLSEQPQKHVPVRDEQGRTPVERLIADEE